MRISKQIVATMAAIGIAASGSVAFGGQEDRRAAMKDIGKAAKAVFQGGDVEANAQLIIDHAKEIPVTFETNEIMGDSTALPVIWEDFEGFTSKASDLENAAMAVLAAAQDGGDVGAAAKAMGATCGACHGQYRVKQ